MRGPTAAGEARGDPRAGGDDSFTPGRADAEGDLAHVPLTYRPRPGTAPIQTLIARFAAPYRCP